MPLRSKSVILMRTVRTTAKGSLRQASWTAVLVADVDVEVPLWHDVGVHVETPEGALAQVAVVSHQAWSLTIPASHLP